MQDEPKRDDLKALTGDLAAIASPLQAYLEELHRTYLPLRDGAVADYIPELARAHPDWFGICIVTIDGKVYKVGNYAQEFTIQSASKPFVYGRALEDHGRDYVLSKVGVEPSGDAFNSIVLDEGSNRPYNPMVNAGAIATAGLIEGENPAERMNRLLEMFRRYTGREIRLDVSVFVSERTTGDRNRAIAYLMRNFGMLQGNLEETLDLYFQQCSLLVTCHDLGVMAATLANDGVNPITGERAADAAYVQDMLSVMYTCGMYDFSGEWAYRVGLPAKSGVGGGILAVVPRKLGIGVFSPPLDSRGNSVRGVKVCTEISQHFGLHSFNTCRDDTLLRDAISGRL
jgi:glutaminase